VKFPLVLSLVAGAELPAASVPLAAAVQEPEAVPELKVQVKSAEAPGAKVATVAGVKLAQEPPPATLTFVIALSPVFVSVTTTVMVVFGSTVVLGETLLVVSVVAG
jgi:hypothetical protein